MPGRQSLDDVAERLRIALDMFDLGESIMRQNLRRSFPQASDADIEAKLSEWLSQRPGAEYGDAPGRRIHLRDE
jgi:hypothetical protein